MSPKEKFLLGGLGALVPILLSIAVADSAKIAEYLGSEWLSAAGYVVRTLALFLVGAIWVYVDSSVNSRRKAIEIGIVAPALITATINASNVNLERGGTQTALNFGIVSSAHAQALPEGPGPLPPSPLRDFVDGLLGR